MASSVFGHIQTLDLTNAVWGDEPTRTAWVSTEQPTTLNPTPLATKLIVLAHKKYPNSRLLTGTPTPTVHPYELDWFDDDSEPFSNINYPNGQLEQDVEIANEEEIEDEPTTIDDHPHELREEDLPNEPTNPSRINFPALFEDNDTDSDTSESIVDDNGNADSESVIDDDGNSDWSDVDSDSDSDSEASDSDSDTDSDTDSEVSDLGPELDFNSFSDLLEDQPLTLHQELAEERGSYFADNDQNRTPAHQIIVDRALWARAINREKLADPKIQKGQKAALGEYNTKNMTFYR